VKAPVFAGAFIVRFSFDHRPYFQPSYPAGAWRWLVWARYPRCKPV